MSLRRRSENAASWILPANALVVLVEALRSGLELVVGPEYVLALLVRVRLRLAKELLELGLRNDGAELLGVPREVMPAGRGKLRRQQQSN